MGVKCDTDLCPT